MGTEMGQDLTPNQVDRVETKYRRIVTDIPVPESVPVLERLRAMGHRCEVTAEFAIGNMQGILINDSTGSMAAGADPRRMMYAIGW